jgi:hypothetical protein
MPLGMSKKLERAAIEWSTPGRRLVYIAHMNFVAWEYIKNEGKNSFVVFKK